MKWTCWNAEWVKENIEVLLANQPSCLETCLDKMEIDEKVPI